MAFIEIKDEDIIPNYKWVGSEKLLEEAIYENIADISANCLWGDIKNIERQFTLNFGKKQIRADLMLWHTDGTGTLIEIKTGKNNRNDDLMAIGQLLFYGERMERRLSTMPRLVFAAPQINMDVFKTVKRFKFPISFLMFDSDRCIYLSNNYRRCQRQKEINML